MASSVLFFAVSLLSLFCFSSQNRTENGIPHSRLYNPLVCYVEMEGQLYGQNYHEGQRHEPCGPDVKYCQKITAHFIAAGGEVTKIRMKGCDTVTVPPHYAGLGCKGNGCSERTEADEIYNVCCCDSETCNPSSQDFSLSAALVITSLFLYF